MLDQNRVMTKSWRAFFESQWKRSGGFTDFLFVMAVTGNTGDATLAEVAAGSDQNSRRIELLQAMISGGMSESIDQQLNDLRQDISRLNALIQGIRGEDTQASVQAVVTEVVTISGSLGSLTTSAVPECSRPYYSDARARAAIGAGGSLSYNPSTGIISLVVGSAAYQNTGTSGANVPLLNGVNTWSGLQSFGGGVESLNYKAAGMQVVGAQKIGWVACTGTPERGAFATYDAPAISNPPSQAEVQALADALQNVSRAHMALRDDLLSHGLIGA
jgi:hypothetical protein